METYKILIIEDEKRIARFLELELKHEGHTIDIELNGREGLRKVEENNYDLVLLDIMLPGINGMEVCRRIRQFSDLPIIMLTAKGEVMDKVMGLDMGADDYITKPFAIEELLARIRVALRRKKNGFKSSKNLQVSDLIMDISKHQVTRNGTIIELTKKEYDLLEFMMKNNGIVLTREQMLEKVWGYDFLGDTNAVDVYIRYLRSKIDDSYENKLIQTIRGVGYILLEGRNED